MQGSTTRWSMGQICLWDPNIIDVKQVVRFNLVLVRFDSIVYPASPSASTCGLFWPEGQWSLGLCGRVARRRARGGPTDTMGLHVIGKKLSLRVRLNFDGVS
jgi:hypothetical protein